MKAQSGLRPSYRPESTTETAPHSVLDRLWEGYQVVSPDWTYLYVNEAAVAQLGRTKEELIGRSMLDCFPGIEKTEMFDVLQRCMSERRSDQTEDELRYPNGTRARVAFRFLPLAEGVCILSLDVTKAEGEQQAVHDTARTERVAPYLTRCLADEERPLVLVVEDSVEMNRILAKQLATKYRVAVAFDGEEGLRMACELQPDLVLTDAAMPVMTGEELVLGIRERPELSSIPIVVLSAVPDDELRVRLLSSGAQDYVNKPFAMAELEVRVANLVQRKLAEELVQRVAEDQSLLVEVGAALAATLDYDETCDNVAQLATKTLADLCILEVLNETGEIHRLKVAYRSSASESWAMALERLPFDRRRSHFGSSVLETRERLVVNEVTPACLDSIGPSDEHGRVLVELAPRAIVGLPLIAHGHVVGSMILLRTSQGQPFRARDIELAEEMGRRAAMALDNSRLYRRAQRAIMARDDMLGMVAHDLRNPLTAMLLQLRLLHRGGQEPERRSQAPIKAVLREGARLDRLIQDLLDVARVEAGNFAVNPESVRVSELVEELVASNQLLAAESSLRLVLDAEVSRFAELWGDRDRLLQAMDNLVGNAIKFTPPGGTVTVRAVARETEIELSVTDTGPGIADDQVPHLFGRYWQGQVADRRGAGLGLSIAKAIADAHGGRIWVETEVGKGSVFFLALPRSDAAA